MNNNKGSGGLLLLIDGLGLLLTTIVFTMVFTKITGSFDTNVLIVTLFYYGVKLLLMGIADIIGIGKNIVIGIIFILISDFILLAVNLLMAFGISYKVMLISAAADLIVIILIRIFWNKKRHKSFNGDDDVFRNNEIPQGIDLEDGRYEKSRNLLPADDFTAVDPEMIDIKDEFNYESFYAAGTIPTRNDEVYEPVVEVNIEQLGNSVSADSQEILAGEASPLSQKVAETANPYQDVLISAEDEYKSTAADNFFDFELPAEERLTDAPNLNAMDAFFGGSAEVKTELPETEKVLPLTSGVQNKDFEESVSQLFETNESKTKNETVEAESQLESEDIPAGAVEDHESRSEEINQLTQEMNRQFEVLQTRVDNLVEREEALKQREQQLEKSQKVEVRPKEVVLDNEESEIIINADDLELLKAYLRQHPEI